MFPNFCCKTVLRSSISGVTFLKPSYIALALKSYCIGPLHENHLSKTVEVNKTNRKKKSSSHTKEVFNHFEHSEDFQALSDISKVKVTDKKIKSPDALYLMNSKWAKEVTECLKNDLEHTDAIVFEVNPGPGILTRHLLNLDIPKIYALEPDQEFHPSLNKMMAQYGDRLKLKKVNFLNNWKMSLSDERDNGSRIKAIMEGVKVKDWNEEPVVKIIAALPNDQFLKHIIYGILMQRGFVKYGRPELYLFLNPHTVAKVNPNFNSSISHYKPINIMFDLIFTFECKLVVDKKDFIPWQRSPIVPKLETLKSKFNLDPTKLYFMKIVLQKDFYHLIPMEHVETFWLFLKHILRNKTTRVIPEIEKWVPGCGPRLICRGISVVTEFGDLTPQQILDVFIEYSKWPEFDASSFLEIVEHLRINSHDK